MKSLVYLGNTFEVVGNRMTITPLNNRTEAILKLPPSKTTKQCKSFCGVVNYLGML